MSPGKSYRLSYEVNGKVLCRGKDGLYYEAKIVKIGRAEDGGLFYKVHYQGWSKSRDENIHENVVKTRFQDLTPESLKEAQEAQLAARPEKENRDKNGRRKSKKCDQSNAEEEGQAASEDGHNKKKESVTSGFCSEELKGPTFFSPCNSSSLKMNTASGSCLEKSDFGDVRQEEFFDESQRSSWISDKLLVILEEDRRLVEDDFKCPVLPAKFTAKKIVNEYARYIRQVDKTNKRSFTGEKGIRWKRFMKTLDECIPAFLDYFDISIETHVLKKIERVRHRDLVNSSVVNTFELCNILDNDTQGGLRPSQCYGYIYVVRFLAHFEEVMNFWCVSDASLQSLPIFVRGLLKWLSQVAERFWNGETDYEQVFEEFQQRLHEISPRT